MLPFHVSQENTLLHICSTFLAPSDKHLLSSCTPPIPLTYSSSSSGRDTARFCLCVYKQTDTNLTGSNNLWGVTSGSPFPYFLCYPSLRGCHSGPDRWRRKERKGGGLCTSQSVMCICVCVDKCYWLGTVGRKANMVERLQGR